MPAQRSILLHPDLPAYNIGDSLYGKARNAGIYCSHGNPICLHISAIGASQLELTVLAATAPGYLLLAAALTVVMLNYGTQAVYIPLLISMGETRRNIFLGYHYYRILIIAIAIGLSALIWALVPGDISQLGLRNIPSILAIQYWASTIVGAGITPSLLACVVCPNKITKQGGIASMVGGTILTIGWEMAGQPFGLATVLVAFPVSVLLLIVVSALTKKRTLAPGV